MRDYTLSKYTLSYLTISELMNVYTVKYHDETFSLKNECHNHLRNEVSALILEIKFHDIEMRYRKERSNTIAEKVEVKKAYFIENHPNHPYLAKVLDIYDTEIIEARNFVFESFEDFVVRIPDITKWSCYYSMYFDDCKFRIPHTY